MGVAVVALEFDPILRLGGFEVRLATVVLAGAVLGSLLLAGLLARRTVMPARDGRGLAADDVLPIALGAVPGALLGGRLGYALLHLERFAAAPAAALDPRQGGLELALGVAGAAVTGGYAARALTGAAGAWFHVAAIPTLLLVALGKVAMALGGAGQGLPSDAPWATAYTGPGPWWSLGPAVPSHPAQLYEAAAAALVLLVVAMLMVRGPLRRPTGAAWLLGVGTWLAARTVVAAWWRDPAVLGPLNAAQLVALGLLLAIVTVGLVASRSIVGRQRERSAASRRE